MSVFLFTLVSWVHCFFHLCNEEAKGMRKSTQVSRLCTQTHEAVRGIPDLSLTFFARHSRKPPLPDRREKCSTLYLER